MNVGKIPGRFGSCSPDLPEGPATVDVIEGQVAVLIGLDDDRGTQVPRAALPRGAKEGDVIVDGQVDPVLTQAFKDELEQLQDEVLTPSNGGFDL